MKNILALMLAGDLDKANEGLVDLESVRPDLPVETQLKIDFEKACLYSLRASLTKVPKKSAKTYLDVAERSLIDWYRKGISGGWDVIGLTPEAEIGRMANDRDLSLLLQERSQSLKTEIPSKYWPPAVPKQGHSHNCLLANACVATPDGLRLVRDLRVGDPIYSVRLGKTFIQVPASVAKIWTSRATSCIQLNGSWIATPGQRVRTNKRWIKVGSLRIGDQLSKGDECFSTINSITEVDGYFEVYDLAISGPYHNYVADGVLCHNKQK